ncbi:hypothetical protein [Novosphingopyxis sp.]|uniref:hypothetical protein n=1 Tax=Novosphingopyxis sp. TaxID=2709690 RepID=UPI003B5C64AA
MLHLSTMDQNKATQPTGTNCKHLPTETLAAIWEARKRRCTYTGDLIAFSDLDVDHFVPIIILPAELARLKREKNHCRRIQAESYHADNTQLLFPSDSKPTDNSGLCYE